MKHRYSPNLIMFRRTIMAGILALWVFSTYITWREPGAVLVFCIWAVIALVVYAALSVLLFVLDAVFGWAHMPQDVEAIRAQMERDRHDTIVYDDPIEGVYLDGGPVRTPPRHPPGDPAYWGRDIPPDFYDAEFTEIEGGKKIELRAGDRLLPPRKP